jgi:Tc5 transposase DNA-binding domain
MPITCQDIEERVIEACEDLEHQEIRNIAKTAREFDVPEGRLRRRFQGKALSYIDREAHNKVLNEAAERSLCLYIDLADEIGLPIREQTLVIAANAILRNHHSGDGPPRTVSKMWLSRWLSRHPEYQRKTKKPLAAVRKNIHNPQAIQAWFDKLLTVIRTYGIVDTDIYNMDETGFRIGVGRRHKVITRASNNRQYLADPDNRDYVTSIECISAGGVSLAPMIVVKAANLQERWIVDNFSDSTVIAYSDTGYSNDDINLEWLRHFNR